jgi:hypothetical protein
MKKYLLLFTLLSGSFITKSQDLKNVILYTSTNQFDKAKPEVDGYLANEKNAAKPEGWYYKAYIYNALGRVATKPVAESKMLFTGAFDAIKKYASLDAKAPLTTEEKNSTVYNIYYGVYDLGVKTYNANNTAETYELFKKSVEIHDYIYANKLTGPADLKMAALDTNTVWNLAVLANDLKKKDEALVYYKIIADANLSEDKYAGAYDELILHYKKEKDAASFAKYLTAAKKYFPIDKAYWESKEIEFAINDLEGEALINKYEELAASLPDNYYVFYNYGVELDRFITSPEAKGKDIAALKQKLEQLYIKARGIQSTIEVNLQLSKMYYDRMYEAQEQASRIKGTKPTEVSLKNELLAKAKESINKCVPYAEAAVDLLAALKEYKYSDKANYKLALEILANAAKQNGNAAKVAEYEKKKADVDKL